ncbi:MAG TPA: hypothetical protein VE573_17120 [Nitrososphaeraceae archaeon]|jgi:hypothetical protein|nr:hypothetical protein [Nitrososphaeraceae archaeon]
MSWSDWSSLGGSLDGNPAVGSNQDCRLEVFAVWNDANVTAPVIEISKKLKNKVSLR